MKQKKRTNSSRKKGKGKDASSSPSPSSAATSTPSFTVVKNTPGLGSALVLEENGKGGEDDIDRLLDPMYRRTVYDSKTNEKYVLTDRELQLVQRMLESKFPDPEFEAEPDYDDYYTREKFIMPLSAAPEPKRRFIPSKWERMKVLKIVRGIHAGHVTFGKPEQESPKFYLLWGEDDMVDGADELEHRKRKGPRHIPAPKVELPGHKESYHPPKEYLDEERKVDYEKLRLVPGYKDFVTEAFERCLDLYLCPRAEKQRLNIDPESLVPKLPQPHELRPYPTTVANTYYGHTGYVRCLAVDPLGQFLASGGQDGTVRIWDIETGRLLRTWVFPDATGSDDNQGTSEKHSAVVSLAWNPQLQYHMLAAAVENRIELLNTDVYGKGDDPDWNETIEDVDADHENKAEDGANGEHHRSINDEDGEEPSVVARKEKLVEWIERDSCRTTMQLVDGHSIAVVDLAWHGKGEYLSSVSNTSGRIRGQVLVHHVRKRQSQSPFSGRTKGRVQRTLFHPSKPIFFVATQTHVFIYHLIRQKQLKRLSSGAKWISSMAIHPKGDNLLVGTYDRRVIWFDLDLSDKPYRTLKYHKKAVRDVCFHPRYPLMASGADDGAVHVFHARVFDDLMRNPLIVPVKVLQAHDALAARTNGFGVFACIFHPNQPWIFTSGADGAIRLFQNLK